jgi:hypothetical protein
MDGDFDLTRLGDALAACDEEAPGQLEFLSSLVGGFGLGGLEGFELGGLHGFPPDGLEKFDLDGGRGFEHDGPRGFGLDPERGLDLDGRKNQEQICGALTDSALPPDLPGMDRLREACEAIGA